MKFDIRIYYKVLIIVGLYILAGLELAVADSEGDILARIRPIGRINVSPPVAPVVQGVVAANIIKVEPAPKVEPVSKIEATPKVESVSKSEPAPKVEPVSQAKSGPENKFVSAPVLAPKIMLKVDASVMLAGKKVYDSICFACHGTGVANAPRIGNKKSWAPLIAKGEAALVQSTIEGTAKGMPSRGTCDTCSDEDLKIAVEYMVHMGLQ